MYGRHATVSGFHRAASPTLQRLPRLDRGGQHFILERIACPRCLSEARPFHDGETNANRSLIRDVDISKKFHHQTLLPRMQGETPTFDGVDSRAISSV